MMTALEYHRRNLGMSQKNLAHLAEINYTLISQIERKVRRAYPKLMKALADALGVPQETLFSRDGWPLDIEETKTKKLA